MAEGGGRDKERFSISEAVKSHKKYGSIMNNANKHELLIKHIVKPGETLQGIALRYEVTMEQIRRANKIWTNESLFLRETLLIPIPSTSNELFSKASNFVGDNEIAEDKAATTSRPDVLHPAVSDRLKEGNESNDKSNQTIADILIRIDNSIAQTRNQVEQREKLQDQQIPDDCLSHVKQSHHCHHQSRMRQSLQSRTSPDNGFGGEFTTDSKVTVQPVAMSQGKRVKSSLRRLQREQDEMFEL